MSDSYIIITVSDPCLSATGLSRLLEKEVNEKIAEGYIPIGGAGIHASTMYQSMYRRKTL